MNPLNVGADSATEAIPQIPDFEIIKWIGKGAYGKVWLARSIVGGFRAIKVVKRDEFKEERPYQREFTGICKFEPISRSHPGLVAILHVGQTEQPRYFYYVMELADDVRAGQTITAETYHPRTLKEEMANHPHLPLHSKLQIALTLTSALGYIHDHGLIHRDIKPSNVIFVNGAPKIADIGLITEAGPDVSEGGTLYYMTPEGPGAPTGDIYSLGKVFYELFMGLPPKQFPELPDAAEEFTTVPELLRINNLILKACHQDPRRRFQTARELHKALQAVGGFQEGQTDTRTKKETEPSPPTKPGVDPRSGTVIVNPEKTTGAAASDERKKSGWTRRGALLIGAPAALGGAFMLGKLRTLDEPTKEEKLRKWLFQYELMDDKLACFIGYVGTQSPNTKFLVYSRGTDKKWKNDPDFQKKWVEEIESRFPALQTGRISTITIEKAPGWDHPSFKAEKTAAEMKERVKSLLRLPNSDSTPMPAKKPIIVLMDTTAAKGVYDEESKKLGISNAEVLKEKLQVLQLQLEPINIVPISVDSAKRTWRGEQDVLDRHPSLVIIHRSAFFHAVNVMLGLGYPKYDQQDRLTDWEQ